METQGRDKLELKKGMKMLGWVRFISKGIGVWPLEPNLYLNNVCLAYFTYIMITEYIAMFLCLPNLKKIVNLLAESLPFTQIYLRTLLLRIHIDKLRKVADECMKDYRVSAFANPEEIYIFMGYIKKGKFYVKIGASFVFAASTSWFLRPVTSSAPMTTIIPATNETPAQFIYNLPYKFHIFYGINDYPAYFLTYMSWSPFLYISCIGSITSQIMIIALAYHVSGKLAVLASRINALKNTKKGLRQNLAKILSEHSRLLEMGEGIKVSFAMALLTYLIVGTIQICIIGYHILVIITTRQQRNLMPLFTFILITYFVISIYCILKANIFFAEGLPFLPKSAALAYLGNNNLDCATTHSWLKNTHYRALSPHQKEPIV
ncbi:uncharacterized protein LOC123268014 [Cotesia glomerata]|uniref:uncharacterized protein LOC123268014 n=1 Tax=Cotesia glomerata TaxID=32391 RepID=UPI001D01D345|nr:uncharacterized protein LOC123268014 [Cotesia glomerata]